MHKSTVHTKEMKMLIATKKVYNKKIYVAVDSINTDIVGKGTSWENNAKVRFNSGDFIITLNQMPVKNLMLWSFNGEQMVSRILRIPLKNWNIEMQSQWNSWLWEWGTLMITRSS